VKEQEMRNRRSSFTEKTVNPIQSRKDLSGRVKLASNNTPLFFGNQCPSSCHDKEKRSQGASDSRDIIIISSITEKNGNQVYSLSGRETKARLYL
jgi:hypothetical protein